MKRAAGILVHPTSLPGAFGSGDFGFSTERFLDWAASAGQRYWQVLPLGPTGVGNSPYGLLSSFAGNPLLISLERLADEKLLTDSDIEPVPPFSSDETEFHRVLEWKCAKLRRAWERFQREGSAGMRHDYARFLSSRARRVWLDDWTLFVTLKRRFHGIAWPSWSHELAHREPRAIEEARRSLAEEIAFEAFVQFLFFRHWNAIRSAARERNIRIIGDLPIYVALDSADVWAHRELFYLGEDLQPTVVAGVPPDYFSETGQLWGNPLYRWETMARDGYSWWQQRLRANLALADLVRLDHFRAFAAYWEVPANEPTAIHGRWREGPRHHFFEALRRSFGGDLPFVAEDLGLITPDVDELRRAFGLPGMRVLQFGFSESNSLHLPHNHEPGMVVYTGTHDNDTTRGWYQSLGDEDRRRVSAFFGADGDSIEWKMIRAAYESVCELAIVPIQDVFGLGSEARMNIPGESEHNWGWRAREEVFAPEIAHKLRRLAELTGRRCHPEA